MAELDINKKWLGDLQQTLQGMLADVTNQVDGIGNIPIFNIWCNPVDQSLSVQAPGGAPGSSGGNSGGSSGGSSGSNPMFAVGQELNAKLSTMGGSVNKEVTWLQTVLQDMIQEIGTTITQMGNADVLNAEQVQTLMTDFQQTIADVNAGPGGSSSTTTQSPN
jgi:hypothetical protein